ncbi:MAG: prepilin-type N-terminal cleavage/methylation domain-containing protein [Verrucomicrobia bacterium]|nr:prepilin-type N-terminal cleavage/methylation domain-containing protein [Verrucomicrobiota bacterium]
MTHNSNKAAFTLVEMLVVIAIIAILAALVTAGARRAAEGQKLGRVKAELANLESVIERYQNDQHFYPPGGLKANGDIKAELPPLFYELSGTRYDGTQYRTIQGDAPISDSEIKDVFGVTGFANSNPETAKNYFSNLKTNQYSRVRGVNVLIVPVEGPAEPEVMNDFGRRVNTWRYVSKGATNNPASFDLWADIIVGSKTNRIANWKE